MTSNHHMLAISLYLLSGLLDAVDGLLSRLLNQTSRLGAILDIITDMCCTMCLLATLSALYPGHVFILQISMVINISSHWIHVHTSILNGSRSHKNIDENGNWLLKIYYTSRPFLFFMVAGSELFYASLYLLKFTAGSANMVMNYVAWATAPVALAKTGFALLQGILAAKALVCIDVKERREARIKRIKRIKQ